MTKIFPGRPRPLLFAHRGAALMAPENTMEAFDLAVRLGTDVLEMDVHLTRDNEVVVIHDPTLERTTNGRGLVKDKTLAELQALDAGAKFSRHGANHFSDRGLIIPRLEDVLRAFGRCAVNIELKQARPSMVRPVLETLARLGSRDVVLAAADDGIMVELEASRPGCALGLSRGQVRRAIRGTYFGGIPAAWRGRAMQIPVRLRGVPVASARLVHAAQKAGLEVHLWTINDAATALHWLKVGVEGIMTDDPAALVNVVGEFRRQGDVA